MSLYVVCGLGDVGAVSSAGKAEIIGVYALFINKKQKEKCRRFLTATQDVEKKFFEKSNTIL